MTSGTSGAMRWFFALLSTALPALAKAVSTSPATLESRAENTTSDDTTAGSHVRTFLSTTLAGICPPVTQRTHSPYVRPAVRSEAATSASSNHG